MPTKTPINLLTQTSFGGVGSRRNWVNFGFVLTREISNPRIPQTERISTRAVVHTVKLTSVADVNRQLKAWIREAYQVGEVAGWR